MLFYTETGDVSPEVWDVLLYQILGQIDANAQQAFYQAHITGDENTKQAYHSHYSSETLAALREHVESFIQHLDELSAKTIGRDPNVHPRLPLIRGHNDFVKSTFWKVRQRYFG
jgi:hypothetical protein